MVQTACAHVDTFYSHNIPPKYMLSLLFYRFDVDYLNRTLKRTIDRYMINQRKGVIQRFKSVKELSEVQFSTLKTSLHLYIQRHSCSEPRTFIQTAWMPATDQVSLHNHTYYLAIRDWLTLWVLMRYLGIRDIALIPWMPVKNRSYRTIDTDPATIWGTVLDS